MGLRWRSWEGHQSELEPQAHARPINNPTTHPSEEGRETRAEPHPGPGAVSQSGRQQDSSSAAPSPLSNPICCYDMAASDGRHALIRRFLLQPEAVGWCVCAG